MIVTRKMSNIKCDCCGTILDEDSWVYPEDIGFLKDLAHTSQWVKHKGKHYCPDCYSYDDNDNLVINETRRKV